LPFPNAQPVIIVPQSTTVVNASCRDSDEKIETKLTSHVTNLHNDEHRPKKVRNSRRPTATAQLAWLVGVEFNATLETI